MDLVNWVLVHGGDLLTGTLAILGGFSILAKLTPTEADDKAINFVLSIIHSFGLTKK